MNVPQSVLDAIAEVARTAYCLAWAEADDFRVPGDVDYARAEDQRAKDAAQDAVARAMVDVACTELHRARAVSMPMGGILRDSELGSYIFERTAELRDRCRRCGYEARAHQAPDGGGCPGDFAPRCLCMSNPRAMADGCEICKPRAQGSQEVRS